MSRSEALEVLKKDVGKSSNELFTKDQMIIEARKSSSDLKSAPVLSYIETEEMLMKGSTHYIWRLYAPIGNDDGVGWILDQDISECIICTAKFSAFNRRHHCRSCGGIVCADCSLEEVEIEEFKELGAQKVCSFCYWGQHPVYAARFRSNGEDVSEYLRESTFVRPSMIESLDAAELLEQSSQSSQSDDSMTKKQKEDENDKIAMEAARKKEKTEEFRREREAKLKLLEVERAKQMEQDQMARKAEEDAAKKLLEEDARRRRDKVEAAKEKKLEQEAAKKLLQEEEEREYEQEKQELELREKELAVQREEAEQEKLRHESEFNERQAALQVCIVYFIVHYIVFYIYSILVYSRL